MLAALTTLPLRISIAHQLDVIASAAALGFAESHNVSGPVFNTYKFDDYLIFSGIEPFFDGRAELYGDAFIKRYGEAILGMSDQLPALLGEYGITWTLLERNSSGKAARLFARLATSLPPMTSPSCMYMTARRIDPDCVVWAPRHGDAMLRPSRPNLRSAYRLARSHRARRSRARVDGPRGSLSAADQWL